MFGTIMAARHTTCKCSEGAWIMRSCMTTTGQCNNLRLSKQQGVFV